MTARRVLIGIAVALLGLLAAVAAFIGAALVLTEAEVPRGVTLAGTSLGGLSEGDAATTVRGMAQAAAESVLFLDPAEGPESLRAELTAADAGIAVDVEASLDELGALLPSPVERVRAVLGRDADPPPLALDLAVSVDPDVRDRVAAQLADDLSVEPVAATVAFDAASEQVTTTPATDGGEVTPAGVVAAIESAAAQLAGGTTGQVSLEVAAVDRPAEVSDAEAQAVAESWRALAGATVRMLNPEGAPVAQIRGVDLAVLAQPVAGAAPGGLELGLAPEPLETLLTGPLTALEVEPEDARITIAPLELAPPSREEPLDTARWGGTTSVAPGTPGSTVDWAGLSGVLLERARTAGGSAVPWDLAVPLTPVDAALTTEAAEALGVSQPVASFTTFHACCESRVTNIHRIAEIVDGVQILPGEHFEVNHFVGERTVANGFAEGGAILDGEFVTDVGGGVSQFATTFFNASWFSGAELVSHQPHSIYISRYPAGREATINFPGVNLEIANDSPYAIVVDTSFTDTSITVTFWSTPWWAVETITGSQRPNDLGSFNITVSRERAAPDGTLDRDEFTTVYRLESTG